MFYKLDNKKYTNLKKYTNFSDFWIFDDNNKLNKSQKNIQHLKNKTIDDFLLDKKKIANINKNKIINDLLLNEDPLIIELNDNEKNYNEKEIINNNDDDDDDNYEDIIIR